MVSAKQYIVSDDTVTLDQYYSRHIEGYNTWEAMKDLLYSRVAPTKHCTNVAFQKLCSTKQGPN
jgi:hypothetical protein